jgi:hypothetical protein
VRRWWENSGDFVGARMELTAPNGVRATLLVDSSFDGYDENGLKFGPPRRKERDLRRAGMRPELDQRIVDAWLSASREQPRIVIIGTHAGAEPPVIIRSAEEAARKLGGTVEQWLRSPIFRLATTFPLPKEP